MIRTEGNNNPRYGIKSTIVLLVLLFLLSGIPLLHAQDKEDEKEKKKKGKTKDEPQSVIITDKDLETDTPGKRDKKTKVTTKSKTTSTGAAAHKTPTGKSRSKTPVKKKPDPKTTEKYWRDMKEKLEKNILDNKQKIKKIETRLNSIRGELLRAADTTTSLKYRQEIDELSKNLRNFKRGLGNLERALAELPDKARRAGVPPGWVR